MRTKEEKSILTHDQKKKISFNGLEYEGQKVDLIVELRYDDECRNGHNSFSITGTLYPTGKRSDLSIISCGCIHEAIRKLAPEYAKYIKWHFMSSEEPFYYIANTLYFANEVKEFTKFVYLVDDEFKINKLLGIFSEEEIKKIIFKYGVDRIRVKEEVGSNNREPDIKAARSSAIAPRATLKQLQSEAWLKARLPKLRREFKAAMEELGFIY